MKIELIKMKADLKVLAKEIRNLKSKRKDTAHNNGCGLVNGLGQTQWTFRANHIAYCMLRGQTLEQIEPKLRDSKSWTHHTVRKEAARIVESILNSVPTVEVAPVVKKETLWNKVTNFLS